MEDSKMMRQIIALMTALTMVSGCATMKDGLILGAGSGAVAGAAVGLATHSGGAGSALIGGAIGAAVGTGIAYLVQGNLESRDNEVRKNTLFSLEKFGVSDVPSQSSSVPAITFHVVEEQKVETHRQGNRVIEGHRIWILSDDSNILYSGGQKPKQGEPQKENDDE
jgi:hypothetical protein